jgi:hypothetical protein
MISWLCSSLTPCTVGTTIESPTTLHTVTDYSTLTMLAARRKRMNGAFEAIECIGTTLMNQRKRSIIVVVAHIASPHTPSA